MLTAAPVVRLPMAEIGAPGKTDFSKIYIATELNKKEYRTTLRHEQGHVWSRHNTRRPKNAKPKLWEIACEIEIARVIYDEEDISNVTAPRSRLEGGILPDSIPDLPEDICLAEDIYEWLLENPQSEDKLKSAGCICGCGGEDNESDSNDGGEPSEAPEGQPSLVVAAARERLDINEAGEKSQAAVFSVYHATRNRPPSLTDEIDAALRVRIQRERSHRRPSRRESSGVIFAGSVSVPRPPLVEIFVDRSGSFTPNKTAQAETRLKQLLSRYGASIKADVWFFGNGRLVENDPGGGGDTPYHLVAQHLSGSLPKLAIIITDDDGVDSDIRPIKGPKILCIPIECNSTKLARAIGGVDAR